MSLSISQSIINVFLKNNYEVISVSSETLILKSKKHNKLARVFPNKRIFNIEEYKECETWEDVNNHTINDLEILNKMVRFLSSMTIVKEEESLKIYNKINLRFNKKSPRELVNYLLDNRTKYPEISDSDISKINLIAFSH